MSLRICRFAGHAGSPIAQTRGVAFWTLKPATWAPPRQAHTRASKIPVNLRNEQIIKTVERAQLVDQTGQLRPLDFVERILSTLDRKREYLELVQTKPVPIVKIINRMAEVQSAREKKTKLREQGKPAETKEIQLTWGIASGDLVHKLKKVRKELEKGNRVDLVFAPKKGQEIPSHASMNARIDETSQHLLEAGIERSRPIQNNIAVIRYDGIRQPLPFNP